MYSVRGVINIIDIDIAYFLLKRKMFQFVVGEREKALHLKSNTVITESERERQYSRINISKSGDANIRLTYCSLIGYRYHYCLSSMLFFLLIVHSIAFGRDPVHLLCLL